MGDHKLMSEKNDYANVLALLSRSPWHTGKPETDMEYHGARDCQCLSIDEIVLRYYSGVHLSVNHLAEELRAPLINHIVFFKCDLELDEIYDMLDNTISAPLGIRMPMYHTDMMLCRDFVQSAMWEFPVSAVWKLRMNGKYDLREERLCWMQVVHDLENGVFRTKEDFFCGVFEMAQAHAKIQPEGSRAHQYAGYLMSMCSPQNIHRTMMEWRVEEWKELYVERGGVSFTTLFYRVYRDVDIHWYRARWADAGKFMTVEYYASLMCMREVEVFSPLSSMERKRTQRRHNYNV